MTQSALFDYPLPPDLIAQVPIEPRDAARLLVTDRAGGETAHRTVADLPDLLRPGDLLVLNRTRVVPARLFGRKDTGGEVEVLLIAPAHDPSPAREAAIGGARGAHESRWSCLIRGRVRAGTRIRLDDVEAVVIATGEDGTRLIDFGETDALALAERIGHMPLPPYIRRDDQPTDRERYQTVFADRPGSVAAPTASLHLTSAVLGRLRQRGVGTTLVDLAIGPGTFKPVDTERIEDFRIHGEACVCPAEAVAAIAACRARGGRVIAAGTTVVRTLESAAAQAGGFAPFAGQTHLFMHPPRTPQVVDGLLTNFHLPRSSLLMLVACFIGIERLHVLYAEAVARRYRFFSYGDAMLVLP